MSRRHRSASDTSPFDTLRLEGTRIATELFERAARDLGSYEVTPCLPVDVLGVYVLLPADL